MREAVPAIHVLVDGFRATAEGKGFPGPAVFGFWLVVEERLGVCCVGISQRSGLEEERYQDARIGTFSLSERSFIQTKLMACTNSCVRTTENSLRCSAMSKCEKPCLSEEAYQ